MKFVITIEEMLSDDFEVDAETAEEAMRIAEENYHTGKFVLVPGNLIFKQMAISSPTDETIEWTEF